jgi:hypothetical protein
MRNDESAQVRVNRKDQLDILSKYYGMPRSKVIDALIEEKFQSLQEEKSK